MVERCLAKAKVAGSNPVFRSKFSQGQPKNNRGYGILPNRDFLVGFILNISIIKIMHKRWNYNKLNHPNDEKFHYGINHDATKIFKFSNEEKIRKAS